MFSFRIIKKLMGGVASLVTKFSDYYVQVRLLPKHIGIYKSAKEVQDVGIVIQGPLVTKDDFTFETVKLYKNTYVGAKIVLSTWEGEDLATLKRIEALGVSIVLNKDVKDAGPSNFNRQLLCTRSGILALPKLRYVLKVRSDMRMYNRYAISYLKSLVDNFSDRCANFGKIVVMDKFESWDRKVFPFWIQDFLYFGYMDDIKKFFEIDYVPKQYANREEFTRITGLEATDYNLCTNKMVPEYIFSTSYIKKFYPDGDFTDREFFNSCLREFFILISPMELSMYWAYRKPSYFLDFDYIEENKATYNYSIQSYLGDKGGRQ